jgi:hypothetical protein
MADGRQENRDMGKLGYFTLAQSPFSVFFSNVLDVVCFFILQLIV